MKEALSIAQSEKKTVHRQAHQGGGTKIQKLEIENVDLDRPDYFLASIRNREVSPNSSVEELLSEIFEWAGKMEHLDRRHRINITAYAFLLGQRIKNLKESKAFKNSNYRNITDFIENAWKDGQTGIKLKQRQIYLYSMVYAMLNNFLEILSKKIDNQESKMLDAQIEDNLPHVEIVIDSTSEAEIFTKAMSLGITKLELISQLEEQTFLALLERKVTLNGEMIDLETISTSELTKKIKLFKEGESQTAASSKTLAALNSMRRWIEDVKIETLSEEEKMIARQMIEEFLDKIGDS